MAVYTFKDGELRLYDAFEAEDATIGTEFDLWVYDDSLTTYTRQAAAAKSKSGSSTGGLFVAANDKVYIGFLVPFNRVRLISAAAGAGAGALTVKYWDGSAWATVPALVDGTVSGGNTFAQSGIISWAEPANWVKNDPASVGTNLYYVELSTANVPTTAPEAEYLGPVSGQFYRVAFAAEVNSAPLGVPRPEERLILDRQLFTPDAHYVVTTDRAIYEPRELQLSALLDTDINRQALLDALQCGNPGTRNWARAGVSTKGDSKNDGMNPNPQFLDATIKTVCVQLLWQVGSSTIGYSWNEVWFQPQGVQVAESDDLVTLQATGQVYGTTSEITAFGYNEGQS